MSKSNFHLPDTHLWSGGVGTGGLESCPSLQKVEVPFSLESFETISYSFAKVTCL